RPPQARRPPRRRRHDRLQLCPPPRLHRRPGDADLPRRTAPRRNLPGGKPREIEAGFGNRAAGVGRPYRTGRGNAWVTEVSITGWLTTITVRSSSGGAWRLKVSTLAKMASTTSRAVSPWC